MKIVIVGGHGTIGRSVVAKLAPKHEILIAGRKEGDIKLDITDIHSIEAMYQSISDIDAVVCIAGEAKWDYLDQLSESDYYIGIKSKLMGQVNLVRLGLKHLKPQGSFTLSTGILADDPVPMTASAAMVNGAIHSFAQAAALELKNGMRLNVVSLGLVEDSAKKYEDYFPGHNPIPMSKAANAYVRSIEGRGNGQIIRIYT